MGRLSDMREAAAGNGAPGVRVQEALAQSGLMQEILSENMTRLELALEDEGWRKMSQYGKQEFTRAGIKDMVEISRLMYLSSPLIQRAVNVTTYYTWAQGCTFEAEEDRVQKEVVDVQTDDYGNKADIYGHKALIETHVDQMLDGTLFVALFTDPVGDVSTRTIPVDEIQEIHTKPGDRMEIRYYRRVWVERIFNESTGTVEDKGREALHPDWRFHPRDQKDSIGGVEVLWDAPIVSNKTGGLKHMMFGVPSVYSSLPWARAHKKFLEDWHTLVASLAKFAWSKTTSPEKVKKAAERLQSTVPTKGKETNRPPTAGSVHIGTEDDTLAPIPKTGATTSIEDAKGARLMIASAMDLPDTILSSDPQQGALATAKTLDRPTELGIMNWQQIWRDVHQNIFLYTVDEKVRRGQMPGKVIDYDPGSGLTKVEHAFDPTVNVTFPDILEHDTKGNVEAIVAAATLMGRAEAGTIPQEMTSKLLLEALGADDIEDAMNELEPREKEELDRTVEAVVEALNGHK